MERFLGGLAVALVVAGTSWADPTVLLEDNFDNEVLRADATTLANWTVFGGYVDVIGKNAAGTETLEDVLPGNGCYIDLDGTTGNAGWFVSNQAFYFASDTMYTVTLRLAGNNVLDREASDSDRVVFGLSFSAALNTWEVAHEAPFETVSFDFRGTDCTESLVFHNSFDLYDVSGARDYAGPKIDNVVLTEHTPCVPAPGAFVLSSLGAGLVGFFRRRRIA